MLQYLQTLHLALPLAAFRSNSMAQVAHDLNFISDASLSKSPYVVNAA